MGRSLSDIEREYEEIMHSELSDYDKDRKLAALMTEMEMEFSIPLLQDTGFEQNNKAIIAMYRKLSMSRQTL